MAKKLIHNIHVSLFIKEEEPIAQYKKKYLEFFPFDVEKLLKEKKVESENESTIYQFTVILDKQKMIRDFLSNLIEKLSDEQKNLIVAQTDSRVNDEMQFFLRFDKVKFLSNELWLIDSGECIHIRMTLACYPHSRENALKIVEELFG